jgi:hypothetical protein
VLAYKTRPAAGVFPTGCPRVSGCVASDTAAGTVTVTVTGLKDGREPDEPMLFDQEVEAEQRSPPGQASTLDAQRSPVRRAVVFATLRRQEVMKDEVCDVAAQPSLGGEVEAEMNLRDDTTERGFFGDGGETV